MLCTRALEEHCKVRIAIEDMRNKDATSAIEDHTAYTVTLRLRLGLGLGVTSAPARRDPLKKRKEQQNVPEFVGIVMKIPF
ncbi:unnamed protein product [Rhizophagus irregularis]|nr:unnamed protein product [Rhizophagus irregularis]